VVLCCAGLLVSGCAGGGRSVVAEFPLDPCSDAIYVPVTCRGQDHLFLLDTGASLCILDRTMRAELGPPIGRHFVRTASGEEAIELFHPPPIKVGELMLHPDDPVICQDLYLLKAALDRPISGIIGMSLLRDYALELNPDERYVRLLESPAPDTSGYAHAMRVDVEPYRGPELAVDVGDTSEIDVLLDTGCSYFGSLDYRLCEKLLTSGRLGPFGHSTTVTPHRSVSAHLVVLDTLRVGPFVHSGSVLGRSESTVLGLPFLLGYTMLLDLPARRAFLGRRGDGPFEGCDNPMGMVIGDARAGCAVSAVAPGSPAATAGLRVGDLVISMDDNPVGAAPLGCVQEYLRNEAGEGVVLEIDRDGRRLTAAVDVVAAVAEPPDSAGQDVPRAP
jgi:hypothetical protein